MMTRTRSYFFSPPFFFSSSVNRSPKPQSKQWEWSETTVRQRLWKKGKAREVLPLTLMSMPGSAKIWSTVSTWFLLQALWRRVSPSTRTNTTDKHTQKKEEAEEKREIKNQGVPDVLPIVPVHMVNTPIKYHRNVTKHTHEKNPWPKKSTTRQWGCD